MTEAETLALLITLEEQLIDPSKRASPEIIAPLLSDDFFEFTASGRIYEKEPIIAALAAESGAALAQMSNEGYALKFLAEDVALLTYRHVARQMGAAEARSLRSSIWKLTGGRWRLVFHQGTPSGQD